MLATQNVAARDPEIEKLWEVDTTYPEEVRPIRLNDTTWDELVVDPITNDIYPGKPWLVMFYDKDCKYCQEMKTEFESFANRSHEIANWGMVDGHASELLKETFDIQWYPTMILIQNGMAYEYEGTRIYESVRAFIIRDHVYIKKQYEIPPRIYAIGLQLKYLERKLPLWEQQLDTLVFKDYGY